MRVFLAIILMFSALQKNYASELLNRVPNPTLDTLYEYLAKLTPKDDCDIGEHMPLLRKLAKECPIVTEIGVRFIVSTWGLLKGLSENPAPVRQYIGIDIHQPPLDTLKVAKKLAEEQGVQFTFLQGDDLYLDIQSTDLLFIDSLHTYCHLTYELETFSPKVRKYIAMHDTSEPWGTSDDDQYHGDYSEYPAHYNRLKRGLWPAVEDFLARHPEWKLEQRHFNSHGFTLLRRIGESE